MNCILLEIVNFNVDAELMVKMISIDVFGWLMRGGWLVGWAGFYLMLLYFVLIFG